MNEKYLRLSPKFQLAAADFERDIVAQLSHIWCTTDDSDSTSWTAGVNQLLAQKFENKSGNQLTASKHSASTHPEWLYDFVVYTLNNLGLNSIRLVVECEWRNGRSDDSYFDAIQPDFEKLLVSRSEYRLMIIEGRNLEAIKQVFESLIKIINAFSQRAKNDRYLLVGWSNGDQFFYCDLFIVE